MNILLVKFDSNRGLELQIKGVIPAGYRRFLLRVSSMLYAHKLAFNSYLLPISSLTNASVAKFLFDLSKC
jgi:hypothetical protein